jgi:hypothetical protein
MAESNKTPACNARIGVMPGNPNECRTHALECTNLAETALNKNARETFLYFASAWFKLASQIENSEALVSKWGGQSRLTQLIQQQRSGQSASLSANDEQGKLALIV